MKNKGFTLIELLVVIAIIGLLASIVFASVSSAREKAVHTTVVQEGKEIKKALELSRLSAGSYPVLTEVGIIQDQLVTDSVPAAILEYLAEIPEVPEVVAGVENSGHYYISNGSEAIDEEAFEYRCGASGSGSDEYVLFYRDDTLNPTPDGEDTLYLLEEQSPYPGWTSSGSSHEYGFNEDRIIAFSWQEGDVSGSYRCVK